MTWADWAIRPFRHYADFSGRSPRAEYWWFRLTIGIIGFILGLLDVLVLHGPIYGSYGLLGLTFVVACAIPGIAVLVRRLHDIERSGWWAVVGIPVYGLAVAGRSPFAAGTILKGLPTALNIVLFVAWIAGVITVFVFCVTPGTEGSNRYGPDPYGPDALEEVFA